MRIKLQREGVVRNCRLGFSWTTLFFGWWVPFFRFDLKWGIVMLIGAFVLPGLWEGYTYQWGHLLFRVHLGLLLNVIMAIYYNAIHVADLLEKGYAPVDAKDAQGLFDYRLYIEEEDPDGED